MRERRPGSPTPGCSILTTSAPSQASAWVQEVPASYWVMSSTRIRSRAGIGSLLQRGCEGTVANCAAPRMVGLSAPPAGELPQAEGEDSSAPPAGMVRDGIPEVRDFPGSVVPAKPGVSLGQIGLRSRIEIPAYAGMTGWEAFGALLVADQRAVQPAVQAGIGREVARRRRCATFENEANLTRPSGSRRARIRPSTAPSNSTSEATASDRPGLGRNEPRAKSARRPSGWKPNSIWPIGSAAAAAIRPVS